VPFEIISYCCGEYPSYGGVARYDAQLKLTFPHRYFYKGPEDKQRMLERLSTLENPIVITDNHLSCDIPNDYPVLLVHHGCARRTADVNPDWDPYWKNLCRDGQDQMLDYRKPENTWIISCSTGCVVNFDKYYGDSYRQFTKEIILHSSEWDELSNHIRPSNDIPKVLGNWLSIHKGKHFMENIRANIPEYVFEDLNLQPFSGEPLEAFNVRKHSIYASSDIFLQLSKTEGNSYAALDALPNGLVLLSTQCGLSEYDLPEDCFVSLEYERCDDAMYIKEKLDFAMEYKNELVNNAYEWYFQHCRFPDWQKKMLDIVNRFYHHNYAQGEHILLAIP